LKVDYDPAVGEPDFDPWDNYYHYWLRGMEEHGGLSTTEVVALFDLSGSDEAFDSIARQIVEIVSRCEAQRAAG